MSVRKGERSDTENKNERQRNIDDSDYEDGNRKRLKLSRVDREDEELVTGDSNNHGDTDGARSGKNVTEEKSNTVQLQNDADTELDATETTSMGDTNRYETDDSDDNIILINTQDRPILQVEEVPVTGENGIGDAHEPENEGDIEVVSVDGNDESDIEIIAARDSSSRNIEAVGREIGVHGADSRSNVSVELIDDWYHYEATDNNDHSNAPVVGHLREQNSAYEITSDTFQESGVDEAAVVDEDEDEDDVIMLDGKPAPTTDELLTQIKSQGPNTTASATTTSTSGGKSFKDVTCAICMDLITDAVAAACGHVFCAGCIYRALASSREPGSNGSGGGHRGKCPMCRKVISYKNLVWLKVRFRRERRSTLKE